MANSTLFKEGAEERVFRGKANINPNDTIFK